MSAYDSVNILSIDGGGIRGIIPAMVLAEIERRTAKPVSELFKLIAGTSTGGIIGLGLVLKDSAGKPRFSAQDLVSFYKNEGRKIFSRSLWRRLHAVGNILDEKYSDDGLEGLLDAYFGPARLKDALADVLITSYEIERRIPWFFKSRNACKYPSTHDFTMKDVARATSAAPTYFEPAKVESGDGSDYYALVDGAVFANNPAMCAYVEAKQAYDAESVRMVSLGTGEHTKRLPYEQVKDWGKIGWAQPILDVVFDGVSDTVNYQMSKIIAEDDYYRFQVKLGEEDDDIDNAGRANIRVLELLAEELISENHRKLDKLCDELAG